jgi:hypothetical protein
MCGKGGIDVCLLYGQWNRTISKCFRRLAGRDFTDRERVFVGVGGFAVAVALIFQAFLIVTVPADVRRIPGRPKPRTGGSVGVGIANVRTE